MTSVPHGSSVERRSSTSRWIESIRVPELWGGIAIVTAWVAVLVSAVWGADFVSVNGSAQSTTIPSAVGIALFAFLATSSIAKYVFRRKD